MQEARKRVLGLDLGTSSVGWALLEFDAEGMPCELVDLGVRHFEEVIEPKTKALKNLKRRTMRMMRKNLRRRRQRRDNLLRSLQAAGMAPHGLAPFGESSDDPREPYTLRARAATEPVTLHELGRALFHLGRRRGFKSNRGAKMASLMDDPEARDVIERAEQAVAAAKQTEGDGDADAKKEEGEILAEISSLRAELRGRTLGQFFLAELEAGRPVRGRHTDRGMYEDEFERIWSVQGKAHPGKLTDDVRARIHYAIFHQRPLRVQKFLKGPCSLERRKVRAERGQLIAQRFRYWQDIANILLTDSETGERRPLTLDEKHKLAAKLDAQAEMSWPAVRRELRLPKHTEFNLEKAKGGKLKGNRTWAQIAGRAPELWDSLDEGGKERLVETLLTIEDRGKTYKTLRRVFDEAPEVAYKLSILELEGGTASLSAKAMRRILVRMQEGMTRSEAQVAAGYEPWNEEIPRTARLANAPSQKEMTNPRVRKALGQVRKVVNAVLAEYGELSTIRIELAREMSLTKKEKEGLEKAQKLLSKENAEADDWFTAQGKQNPTRADRFWYRLAKQCGWTCPYTGKCIPQELSSMARFQIEHIVPYVRSLDDSFNNLTLCEAETNRAKGNKTPFEAFGHTPQWEHMVARAKGWKGIGTGHKIRLFCQTTTPDTDKMTERQLNESKYIAREAAKFLRPICDEVQATKGGATAMLREHWGLMQALYGVNEKSRDDLRHHAVDAVAVALTSRSIFMRATAHRKSHAGALTEDYKIPPLSDETVPPAPEWLHGRLKEKLRGVVVSHEPSRGIKDAFHKETAMGLRNPRKGVYHFRKPLASMTPGEVDSIVDPGLRAKALEMLAATGGDSAKAFADGIAQGRTVARRARIAKVLPKAPLLSLPAVASTKYFELGSYHHVEIFVDERSGKRRGRYVTTLDAAQRVRRAKHSIVDTTPPHPGLRFVMWLAANDMVLLPDEPHSIYVVQILEGTNERIILRAAHASGSGRDEFSLSKKPNTLRGTKIEVSPLGRVWEVPEGTV